MTSRRAFLAFATAAELFAGTKKYCGIRFQEIKNGNSSRRYFWIHGDELTARDVLLVHMKKFKGRALLVDNPTRVIKMPPVEFDPNRMFTAAGLERNLKRLNPNSTPEDRKRVLDIVGKDREKLLRALTPPANGLLTVVHNNSRGYSVTDEVQISNDVSLSAPDTPNDFLLCTDPKDFALLRKSPFNVVLQNDPKGEEDGSFSRLAAGRKIRYVNIECAKGRFDTQKTMLEWLEHNLP